MGRDRTGFIEMRRAVLLAIAMLGCAQPLLAETLVHPAENNVPVAIVRIERSARLTEVAIETQAARPKVCWYASGPNSPYLLANGHRYRLIATDKVASCPATQDYAAHDTMVLRFEPLEPQVREFSLVEGQGGENQMIDPSSTSARYWNFLHVKTQSADVKPQAPSTKPPGPGAAGR
jgi:hypothetical protein